MDDPSEWDLDLFLADEPAEVREQIGIWITQLKEHFDQKEDFEIHFVVPPNALTPEGAAMPVFDKLLMTYGSWRVNSLSNLEYNAKEGHIYTAWFKFR